MLWAVAVRNQVAHMRQQSIDPLGAIYPFHEHWQVRSNVSQSGHVQFAMSAEPGQATQHGRASGTLVAQVVEDRLPQRFVMTGRLVVFADVDVDPLAGADDVHL